MRLKRKRLGPTINLKEGRREGAVGQAMETEQEEEEDIPWPLAWKKGKKTAAPWKRKQAATDSLSPSKRAKLPFEKFH